MRVTTPLTAAAAGLARNVRLSPAGAARALSAATAAPQSLRQPHQLRNRSTNLSIPSQQQSLRTPPRTQSPPTTASHAYSAAAAPLPTGSLVNITTLPNGLRVATEGTPGHFSAVGVYVDAGSRFERQWVPGEAGVSHLLDRMAFKSTANRSSDQMTAEIEKLGGNVMCSSSRETIMYQSSMFNQDLPAVLSVLSDTVQHPLLLPEELHAQKEAAAYEIGEIWNKPEMILPELLHLVAYQGNSLGNPLLCPMESLQVMTVENLQNFRAAWFSPDRIVVAGAGMPHEELVALSERYFGDAKRTVDVDDTTSALAKERAKYTGGESYLPRDDLEFTHVYMAFEGVSIHDDDIYALATLQILLGGGSSFSAGGPGKGMYSRLYNVLNRHHAVDFCSSFLHSYADSALFGIAASCDPSFNSYIGSVLVGQLELCTGRGGTSAGSGGGITDVELSRARNQLKSSLMMALESRLVEVEDLGRQVQCHGKKVTIEEMCEKIDTVDVKTLHRVANRVLRPQEGGSGGGSGSALNHGLGTGQSTVVAQGNLEGLGDLRQMLYQAGLGAKPT